MSNVNHISTGCLTGQVSKNKEPSFVSSLRSHSMRSVFQKNLKVKSHYLSIIIPLLPQIKVSTFDLSSELLYARECQSQIAEVLEHLLFI